VCTLSSRYGRDILTRQAAAAVRRIAISPRCYVRAADRGVATIGQARDPITTGIPEPVLSVFFFP